MSAPYPWPVKPFDRQHPVRGFFNDPARRRTRATRSTSASTSRRPTARPSTRSRRARSSSRTRVTPWRPGARRARLRLLARQARGRPSPAGRPAPAARPHRGGLGPRPLRGEPHQGLPRPDPAGRHPAVRRRRPSDDRADHVPARQGAEVAPDRLKGRLQICCVAYDTTPIHVPAPWSHMPVAPARLRYRIFCAGRCVLPLRPASTCACSASPTRSMPIYAPDTRQNHPNKPGRYSFILAPTGTPPRSRTTRYLLEVQASDPRQPRRPRRSPFKIRN